MKKLYELNGYQKPVPTGFSWSVEHGKALMQLGRSLQTRNEAASSIALRQRFEYQ